MSFISVLYKPSIESEIDRHLSIYKNLVYEGWRNSWGVFCRDKGLKYDSASYRAADLIYGLLFDNKPVGSMAFRYFDLENAVDQDDPIMLELRNQLDRLGNIKNFWYLYSISVSAERRLRVGGMPTLVLLGNILIQIVSQLNTKYVLSIGNKEVGVDRLIKQFGAKTLTENIRYRNCAADIMYYQLPFINYWGPEKVISQSKLIWDSTIIHKETLINTKQQSREIDEHFRNPISI